MHWSTCNRVGGVSGTLSGIKWHSEPVQAQTAGFRRAEVATTVGVAVVVSDSLTARPMNCTHVAELLDLHRRANPSCYARSTVRQPCAPSFS